VLGLPQGSVLGPLLLCYILQNYLASYELTERHLYADDGPVYVNCPAAVAEVAIRQLGACVADVDTWMKANRLRLNPITGRRTGQFLPCDATQSAVMPPYIVCLSVRLSVRDV